MIDENNDATFIAGEYTKPLSEITDDDIEQMRAACWMFLGIARDVPRTTEIIESLVNEVIDLKMNVWDNMSYNFAWQSLQRKEQAQKELERQAAEERAREAEREAQRKADREDYMRPADRGELARQLQQNHLTQNAPVPPTHQFTDAELDAMSSEDYRRLVLRDIRVGDRQGTDGQVFRPERTGERRERKIKFSPEELAAQECRKQEIAKDVAERRKVKQDLEQAQQAQRAGQDKKRVF